MSTEMRREKEERAPREQIQVRGGEEARKSELLMMMMPFIVARKFGGYKPDGVFFIIPDQTVVTINLLPSVV